MRAPEPLEPGPSHTGSSGMATIRVFIQNEAGSRWKHYHNEKTLIFLGRTAVTVPYPFPYGFILGTTAADRCNVDCFVITRRSLASGDVVECEPVGLMEQFEDGEPDHNVLASPVGERITIDDEAVRTALVHHVENVAGDHVRGKRMTVGRFLDASHAADFIEAHRDKS